MGCKNLNFGNKSWARKTVLIEGQSIYGACFERLERCIWMNIKFTLVIFIRVPAEAPNSTFYVIHVWGRLSVVVGLRFDYEVMVTHNNHVWQNNFGYSTFSVE